MPQQMRFGLGAGRMIAAIHFCVSCVTGLSTASVAPTVELNSPRGGETWATGSYHAIQWNKDRVWILGGGTYDTPTTKTRQLLNDVWSSADGVNWTGHEAAPWQPRQYHAVAVFDDRMWVLGGWSNGDRNDVWYSADGANWYRLNRTPWPERHAASVFVHDKALWIAAGSAMSSDAWRLRRDPTARLDPATDRKVAYVEVALDGLDSRRAHIYDTESPDLSPYPLDLVESERIPTQVYARTFGLNILDPAEKNMYAEMRVDDAGNIRFEKWVDGGEGLKIVVDNQTRPVLITIKWNAK